MPISPRAGVTLCTRQRKSCSSSSALGCLNDVTRVPCALTPRKTCLMVPSFPPASRACNTTSTPRWFSAHNAVWRARSSLRSRRTSSIVSSFSPGAPAVEPGLISASPASVPGRTSHRSAGTADTPSPSRSDVVAVDGLGHADRLVLALHLEGHVDDELGAAGDVFHAGQRGSHAHLRGDCHRSGEAHLVE